MMQGLIYRRAFAVVHGHEGGFINHAKDPGGATNHGVSLRYARSKGLAFDLDGDGDVDEWDIRRITPEQAMAAFYHDFWRPCRCDELPPDLALLVYDSAVNNGAAQAIRWLQRAAGVREDGVFGPLTLAGVQAGAGMAQRFHEARVRGMTQMAGWPSFGRGWAVRLALLPFQAQAMLSEP
jgi:lysozyme family protein